MHGYGADATRAKARAPLADGLELKIDLELDAFVVSYR
jgi:hypothetical protein